MPQGGFPNSKRLLWVTLGVTLIVQVMFLAFGSQISAQTASARKRSMTRAPPRLLWEAGLRAYTLTECAITDGDKKNMSLRGPSACQDAWVLQRNLSQGLLSHAIVNGCIYEVKQATATIEDGFYVHMTTTQWTVASPVPFRTVPELSLERKTSDSHRDTIVLLGFLMIHA